MNEPTDEELKAANEITNSVISLVAGFFSAFTEP